VFLYNLENIEETVMIVSLSGKKSLIFSAIVIL